MLLFRSEEHVDRWCRLWHVRRGATLTLAQQWQLAKLWYGDRLNPDWRPFTIEETHRVFAKSGLIGEFWNLV